MGEAQTPAVDLENPRVERLGESSLEACADGRLDQSYGRLGERRNGARHLERRRTKGGDPGGQQLVEVRRDRQLLAGSERPASALQGGRKLEREEGVAVRGLPEPD